MIPGGPESNIYSAEKRAERKRVLNMGSDGISGNRHLPYAEKQDLSRRDTSVSYPEEIEDMTSEELNPQGIDRVLIQKVTSRPRIERKSVLQRAIIIFGHH